MFDISERKTSVYILNSYIKTQDYAAWFTAYKAASSSVAANIETRYSVAAVNMFVFSTFLQKPHSLLAYAKHNISLLLSQNYVQQPKEILP